MICVTSQQARFDLLKNENGKKRQLLEELDIKLNELLLDAKLPTTEVAR